MNYLTIPSDLRCQVCGSKPSADNPLEMRETEDGYGFPAYVVRCVDPIPCVERFLAHQRQVEAARREWSLKQAS